MTHYWSTPKLAGCYFLLSQFSGVIQINFGDTFKSNLKLSVSTQMNRRVIKIGPQTDFHTEFENHRASTESATELC